MWDLICHDLLLLILKPLRVKTLLQFRCVCKSWKELIDSKSFILDHLSLQSPRLILQNQEFKYVVLDPHKLPLFDELLDPHKLPLLDELSGPDELQSELSHSVNRGICEGKDGLSVVSTVDGLICLYDNANRLLLWNPSIRRLLSLPLPQISPQIPDLFHQHDAFKCCGFWMDPSRNHFKVIIFFLVKGIVALFCSRKQSWLEMAIESERILHEWWEWTREPQILIQGVGYWMFFDNCFDENGVIVSFDFGQDKFGQIIDFPDFNQGSNCPVKWRDCVAIIHWDYPCPSGCDLWVLQNGSWSKMFSFNLFEEYLCPVIYVYEDSGRVLAQTAQGHMVLYDAEDCCIHLESSFLRRGYLYFASDFVESLVFPDRKGIFSDSHQVVADSVLTQL